MKPIGVKLYLTYRCPNCSCDWERSVKEARLLPGFVCQNCQHFCKTDTIDYVEITPHYVSSVKQVNHAAKVKPVPISKVPALTSLQEDAILALVSLGFKKPNAKRFVETNHCTSIEDYIQEAVRQK